MPETITSDRDSRFQSHYWQSLMESLGTKLNFSTAYHPQTDGQSERTIQILEDPLRACILDYGGCWEDYLHLAEFSYNNSFQASLEMAPYEFLYGRRCRTPLCWEDVGSSSLTGPEMVQLSADRMGPIRERLRVAQERQKQFADASRRPLEFEVGEKVFLKVSPSRGIHRFGIKGKLSPRYVGPFEVAARIGEVAYKLILPESLAAVHDVFHVSQLRRYLSDPSHVVEHVEIELQPDLSFEQRPVEILDRKDRVLKRKTIPLVRVAWSKDSPGDSTWEREDEMRERYPYLFDL